MTMPTSDAWISFLIGVMMAFIVMSTMLGYLREKTWEGICQDGIGAYEPNTNTIRCFSCWNGTNGGESPRSREVKIVEQFTICH